MANINAFLSNVAQSVTYTPLANSNTDVTLTVTTNDNGNTGSGGAKTDADTLTLDLQAVNDAPSGTNNAITVLEDNGHTFAAADFGFTDSDGNSLLGVTISTLPAAGSLTLDGVAVSPGQVIPAGSIGLLVWTPPANGNGNGLASLTFQVIDNGGTANGGIDTDASPNTITFNVTPVNDAAAISGTIIGDAN